MDCNECAPLLEDFLYHKLDASTEKGLAEHLSACDSCAREYSLLCTEQELYARCELEIAPDFWTGVQARIASENEVRAQRFAGLFNAFRFVPVGAVVTCLLITVGSIGLWRYLATRSNRPITAEVQNAPPSGVTTTGQKIVPATGSKTTEDALVDRGKRDMSRRRFISEAARAYAKKIEKPVSATDEVVEQNKLTQKQRITTDLDADSARHLEQVEMLLRSFKNGRFLRHSNTLDLKYESSLSKDLLVRNVLLRRDAELAGDVPLTRLLDQFEPFLVDIANLRDNSDSKEIHKVRDSLRKAQIIAAVNSF
jgi:hypothetical protein